MEAAPQIGRGGKKEIPQERPCLFDAGPELCRNPVIPVTIPADAPHDSHGTHQEFRKKTEALQIRLAAEPVDEFQNRSRIFPASECFSGMSFQCRQKSGNRRTELYWGIVWQFRVI